MTRSQVRFFIATVFFFAGTFTLFLNVGQPEDLFSLLTVAVSYPLVALALVREWREDPDAVLLWLGGVLLAFAFILGVYVVSAFQSSTLAKALAALTFLLGLATLVWTWRRQTAPPGPNLPNLLLGMEPRLPIRETNRVQFTVLVRRGGGTAPHWVDLTFQNCGSAPRTVSFRFLGTWTRKVKVPVTATFEIGPAEVWRWSHPVVTGEKKGTTVVELLLPVRGHGGRRVRLRRAWTSQARSLDPIGTVRLPLGPLPAAQWEAELPASRLERLWQPRPGTLPA